MHLHRLDANLLVALNALLKEQSVTRAAQLLCVGQPAMSGALTRLRDHFRDDLITRSGRGMVLTPFGAELAPKVERLIGLMSQVVSTRPGFDPATADRTFSLVTSDYVAAVFLPHLTARILREAPAVTLDVQLRTLDHEARMAAGLVDLFVVPDAKGINHLPATELFEDEYVCIAWEGNERVGPTLSLDDYLRLGHVIRTPPRANATTFEDERLAELGLRRREIVRLPGFEAIPRVVVGTPMIASMQRRLAQEAAAVLPLRILANPLKIPRLSIVMQWPNFRDDDSGSQWLRAMALATARDMPAIDPWFSDARSTS